MLLARPQPIFEARCSLSYSGANVTLLSEVFKFPLPVRGLVKGLGWRGAPGRLKQAPWKRGGPCCIMPLRAARGLVPGRPKDPWFQVLWQLWLLCDVPHYVALCWLMRAAFPKLL